VNESNLDAVLRMFAAFAERDLEGMLREMDEDVEFLPVTANLTTGGVPYRGHAGIARYMEDITRVWPGMDIYPGELTEDGDTVLALGRVRARGGGMIIDQPTGWVFMMRAGKILRARTYGSQEEALDAVRG
jgi:ketosteroid isomerase-like protein